MNLVFIQRKFKSKARECIKLAEDRFDRHFHVPEIIFFDYEYAAGCADQFGWKVGLSVPIILEYPERMLENTLPHELAHLIDFKVNLKTYAEMKRIPQHGYAWKYIMKNVFGAEPLTKFYG